MSSVLQITSAHKEYSIILWYNMKTNWFVTVDNQLFLEWLNPLLFGRFTPTTLMKTCGELATKIKSKDLGEEIMFLGALENSCFHLVE